MFLMVKEQVPQCNWMPDSESVVCVCMCVFCVCFEYLQESRKLAGTVAARLSNVSILASGCNDNISMFGCWPFRGGMFSGPYLGLQEPQGLQSPSVLYFVA